jgi:acyl-CoA synthetase (AMP-forming)/AMP-acid ligase II/thioesterase domain-containing protein/acyl carrier protein
MRGLQWKEKGMHRIAADEKKDPSGSALPTSLHPGGRPRPAIVDGGALPPEADLPDSLPAALIKAAEAEPAKGIIYVAEDDSECSQSYATLLEEAKRILAGLRRLAKPGDAVILQLESSRDFIPAFWACLLGAFIPVPLANPSSNGPTERVFSDLKRVWEVLGRPTVLASAGIFGALDDFFRTSFNREPVVLMDDLQSCEPGQPFFPQQMDSAALYLLTSGSTGIPKIALLTQRNILSSVCGSACVNGFSPREISLNWLPMNHVGALMRSIREVAVGCTQIQATTRCVMANPLIWLDYIDRYRVTTTWAPNFCFGLIVERASDLPTCGRWDFTPLRSMWSSGEAVLPAIMKKFHKLLAPFGLSVEAIHTAWGMTEACFATYSHGFITDPRSAGRWTEVGAPIPGIAARIVDEREQLLAEPEIGRLQIKGSVCSVGYYGDSEKNRQAFTPDGWLRTGDLGFLRDGRLTVTGRENEIIIINGLNYAPGEIEAALAGIPGVEYPNVAACAVEESAGAGERLAVFFHTKVTEGSALLELLRSIRGNLNRKLGINPGYLLPVEQNDIPKTPLGKIQRGLLKRRFEEGAFRVVLDRLAGIQSRHSIMPMKPIEETVAGIWADVLGVRQLDSRDNFFDLGGDSILAIQLIARIEKRFRMRMPVSTLFQHPTIAELAEFLENETGSQSFSPLIPVQPQGSRLPLFWVHGDSSNVFLPQYLDPDQPICGLEHQAQDGRPAKNRKAETIAKAYLDEVRTVQPHGIYLLGGYSFGALTAFEMAQQLTREGEEVKLLFMLDPPHTTSSDPLQTPAVHTSLRMHWLNITHLQSRQKLDYIAVRLKAHLVGKTSWVREYWRKWHWGFFLAAGRPLPASERSAYIMNIYRKARQAYLPQPYAGRVIIFKSKTARFLPEWDWSKLCTGELSLHEGRGEHTDLKTEPYVAQWARVLKAELDQLALSHGTRRNEEGNNCQAYTHHRKSHG